MTDISLPRARTIIGIDPGVSGGIAVLYASGSIDVQKMPDTERDLWDLLGSTKEPGEPKAYIELVRSSPQMGVVSAFTFGRGVGSLRMALIGRGIPFEEVTPHKWRTALGLPKHESSVIGSKSAAAKNIAKARAQQIFPSVKVTHAICDALLIAEYGKRQPA